MRPRKYHVTLMENEHSYLLELINKGKASAQKIKRANILLALDETYNSKPKSYSDIKDAYHTNEHTVCDIAKKFVEGGLEAALERKVQQNRHHKITGDVEANITLIACSDPPDGHDRWTLQMIADRLVELKVIDSISPSAVGTTLKKTKSSRG